MKELRELINSKLDEINDLEVTAEIPDTMLEEGKTYFSFTLQKNFENSDFEQNYTYRVSMLGYIKRLQNNSEDTLQIVDMISDKIEEKLKEINIKTDFADVSILDGIRKIQVQGAARYNEINKRIA